MTDTLVFLLWGWIPVLKNYLWFRALDRKARKALQSKDVTRRGFGRSLVMFMCELIYWEISYLHRRGGWLANRHLRLIDYAADSSLEKGDVQSKEIEKWRIHCYETIGFAGPNRVIHQTANAPIKPVEPLVITEMVSD